MMGGGRTCSSVYSRHEAAKSLVLGGDRTTKHLGVALSSPARHAGQGMCGSCAGRVGSILGSRTAIRALLLRCLCCLVSRPPPVPPVPTAAAHSHIPAPLPRRHRHQAHRSGVRSSHRLVHGASCTVPAGVATAARVARAGTAVRAVAGVD